MNIKNETLTEIIKNVSLNLAVIADSIDASLIDLLSNIEIYDTTQEIINRQQFIIDRKYQGLTIPCVAIKYCYAGDNDNRFAAGTLYYTMNGIPLIDDEYGNLWLDAKNQGVPA